MKWVNHPRFIKWRVFCFPFGHDLLQYNGLRVCRLTAAPECYVSTGGFQDCRNLEGSWD